MKAKFLYGPVDGAEFDSDIVLESNGMPKQEILFPRRSKVTPSADGWIEIEVDLRKHVYTLLACSDNILYYKYARTI